MTDKENCTDGKWITIKGHTFKIDKVSYFKLEEYSSSDATLLIMCDSGFFNVYGATKEDYYFLKETV